MAGTTPQEAVHNFISPLQRALSCLTNAVLDWRGGYQLGQIHAVVLNQGDASRLPGADLAIRVAQSYEVVHTEPALGPYKVSTRAYWYTLEDHTTREIICYHWHPEQAPRFPHLHLGYGADIGRVELQRAHLPTGRISVEEFLRFVIVEFRVPPRRPDWHTILHETQAAFEEFRRWP